VRVAGLRAQHAQAALKEAEINQQMTQSTNASEHEREQQLMAVGVHASGGSEGRGANQPPVLLQQRCDELVAELAHSQRELESLATSKRNLLATHNGQEVALRQAELTISQLQHQLESTSHIEPGTTSIPAPAPTSPGGTDGALDSAKEDQIKGELGLHLAGALARWKQSHPGVDPEQSRSWELAQQNAVKIFFQAALAAEEEEEKGARGGGGGGCASSSERSAEATGSSDGESTSQAEETELQQQQQQQRSEAKEKAATAAMSVEEKQALLLARSRLIQAKEAEIGSCREEIASLARVNATLEARCEAMVAGEPPPLCSFVLTLRVAVG
jgi:hypothetical protein